MILFEEGKLTPDDPVSKFIPAFRNAVVRADQGTLQAGLTEPARREITVRDLFRNTSGIASAGRVPLSYRNQYRAEMETLGWLTSQDGSAGAQTARERVDALARLPLSFHPGTRHRLVHRRVEAAAIPGLLPAGAGGRHVEARDPGEGGHEREGARPEDLLRRRGRPGRSAIDRG
jgi:CubicO group peptidase (beta-lactamase class C family)